MTAQAANSNTVKIVNGKLILSLPEAQMPVVWQIDLDQAQSAAFTVKEDKKEKLFKLVLQKQDGSTDDIAPFAKKKEAVDILMETSNALQNAQDNAPASSKPAAKAEKKGVDKLGAFLAAILIIILVLIWIVSAARPNLDGGANGVSNTSAQSPSSANGGAGMPQNAEDFLNNR